MTAVTVPGARFRIPWSRLAGRAATVTATALRLSRTPARSLPSLAGAAMVSLGIAMIYLPAGVIAGGAFLLWIGTELNRRP